MAEKKSWWNTVFGGGDAAPKIEAAESPWAGYADHTPEQFVAEANAPNSAAANSGFTVPGMDPQQPQVPEPGGNSGVRGPVPQLPIDRFGQQAGALRGQMEMGLNAPSPDGVPQAGGPGGLPTVGGQAAALGADSDPNLAREAAYQSARFADNQGPSGAAANKPEDMPQGSVPKPGRNLDADLSTGHDPNRTLYESDAINLKTAEAQQQAAQEAEKAATIETFGGPGVPIIPSVPKTDKEIVAERSRITNEQQLASETQNKIDEENAIINNTHSTPEEVIEASNNVKAHQDEQQQTLENLEADREEEERKDGYNETQHNIQQSADAAGVTFDKVADNHIQNAEEKIAASEDAIKNNPDLTPEAKAALEAQITSEGTRIEEIKEVPKSEEEKIPKETQADQPVQIDDDNGTSNGGYSQVGTGDQHPASTVSDDGKMDDGGDGNGNTSVTVGGTDVAVTGDGTVVGADGKVVTNEDMASDGEIAAVGKTLMDLFGFEKGDLSKTVGMYLLSRLAGASHEGAATWAGKRMYAGIDRREASKAKKAVKDEQRAYDKELRTEDREYKAKVRAGERAYARSAAKANAEAAAVKAGGIKRTEETSAVIRSADGNVVLPKQTITRLDNSEESLYFYEGQWVDGITLSETGAANGFTVDTVKTGDTADGKRVLWNKEEASLKASFDAEVSEDLEDKPNTTRWSQEAVSYARDNLDASNVGHVEDFRSVSNTASQLALDAVERGDTVNSIVPYIKMARMDAYSGQTNSVWTLNPDAKPSKRETASAEVIQNVNSGVSRLAAESGSGNLSPSQKYIAEKEIYTEMWNIYNSTEGRAKIEEEYGKNIPDGQNLFTWYMTSVLNS